LNGFLYTHDPFFFSAFDLHSFLQWLQVMHELVLIFYQLSPRHVGGWLVFSGNVSLTGTNAVPKVVNVFLYPALNTLGISHARLDFGIGGVIPPHTHPFATETLFVVKGTIYTGFISFENVLYAETLQEGDIYIFPKATLHFQLNVGDGPAVTFNSLTSQNPGFVTAANQLLFTNISAPVLESSLGINAETLKLLQDSSIPLFFGGSKGSS
jgi:quercetin dioxygenase-like cupin family protein